MKADPNLGEATKQVEIDRYIYRSADGAEIIIDLDAGIQIFPPTTSASSIRECSTNTMHCIDSTFTIIAPIECPKRVYKKEQIVSADGSLSKATEVVGEKVVFINSGDEYGFKTGYIWSKEYGIEAIWTGKSYEQRKVYEAAGGKKLFACVV